LLREIQPDEVVAGCEQAQRSERGIDR
jgi:hypothetical protein